MPPKSFALSLQAHQSRAAQLLACHDMAAFARLLAPGLSPLQLAGLQPHYHCFRIPKKSGGFRSIEAPVGPAKPILKRLNTYLQAVYYGCMSSAAYGYIDCPDGDPQPRHIAANARRHLGCAYLLNVDMDDFFHQISHQRVAGLLQAAPFGYDPAIADWLADLTTWHRRLPMGSPASPALSNFATRTLDEQLLNWCAGEGITYTRYVDDLSFSATVPVTGEHLDHIRRIISGQGFRLDEEKLSRYGPEDAKIITGLQLGAGGVEVPPTFLAALDADLLRFRHLLEVHDALSGKDRSQDWLDDFEESLQGRVRFLTAVYGRKSRLVKDYRRRLEDAYDTEAYLESRSWLEFGYG